MKKIKKWKLFLLYPLLTLCLIVIIFITYKLNQSTVILTENGIYQRLQVPVKDKFVDINVYLAGIADKPIFEKDFVEGPIVTYQKDKTISIDWFSEGITHQKNYGSDIENFSINTKYSTQDFILPKIDIPLTEIATSPNKIGFFSDVHGDYQYMITVLKNLKVIDSMGNWDFEDNHLVIVGDMVDRGTEVDKVLWAIVQLSEQAKKVGGMVHYLIGNHEQYILKGNFSRVNPKNLYAIQQMMPFEKAYSKQTYIGKWLRTRPVILKIGNTLIAHGGVSPQTAEKKYTVQQINQAMWDYWDEKSVEDDLKEIILGKTGITQYRGYIRPNDEIKKATNKEVDQVLKTYNASRIIVGHTNVGAITPLFDGKVYDINAIETCPQALVLEGENTKIIDVGIVKKDVSTKLSARDFSLFKKNDLKMISSTIGNIIKLSSIPHPY
ncbi:metallophosphoesterase [Aquimarina sp. 2201CG1-2-11]|uniref:metallophosphoesterase n=1 Tax=Aquimarina discodermiae TaxID=3231043 RepID=UPI003461B98D